MPLVSTSSAGRELQRRRLSRRAWFPGLLLFVVFVAYVAGAGMLGETVAVRPAGAAGPEVRKVRHWSGPEYTRIVIDLSARVSFRHSLTAADPPSLIVELEGASIGAAAQPTTIGDGLVDRVRFLGPEAGVAQAVIELTARRKVKVFALAADREKPHRLVIDVLRGAPEVESGSPGASPADSEAPPGSEGGSAGSGASSSGGVRGQETVPAPVGKPAAGSAVSLPGEGSRPRVVVIDPGHGGDDPGARGPGGLLEKDVCLALGRRLAAELNGRPGIKAYLSRDGDHFLTLRRRTRMAAERKADLFVSIHANANRSRKVRGTEVYFLSLRGASDAEARELATRENAADEVAGVPPESQEDIENIVMDLMRTAALERSSELAATVIERLGEDSRLVIRGVKQAGFDVLKTAGMPSILIEAAFISHREEAKLLKSRAFQQRFASLVGGAIVDYLARTAAAEGPPPPAEPAAAGTAGGGTEAAAASPAGS